MKDVTLEGVLFALGDPIRMKMVQQIACGRVANCAEVSAALAAVPLSTRHHHMRILRENGLLWSERKGVEVQNRLRLDELEKKFPGLIPTLMNLAGKAPCKK
jgi:hypothetical protein